MWYTRFQDIPQLTPPGTYEVDIPWVHLESALSSYQEQGLELNPDFQRGHVWGPSKRRAYVEFCLRGGTSNRTLYFNCPGWPTKPHGDFVLVDGLQRLTAVRMFLSNRLRIFRDMRYRDFTDELHFGTPGTTFRFNINRLETREQVLRWYLEMNTGGVVHTSKELMRVRELLRKEKV